MSEFLRLRQGFETPDSHRLDRSLMNAGLTFKVMLCVDSRL